MNPVSVQKMRVHQFCSMLVLTIALLVLGWVSLAQARSESFSSPVSHYQTHASAIVGQVLLQGRPPAPATSYQIPLTITLSGDNTYHFTPTADAFGGFTLPNIAPGRYTITVKNKHTLAVYDVISLSTTPLTLTLGPLLEGDANGDNAINSADLLVLENSYGQCLNDFGFVSQADFNESQCLTGADFSLLASNFGLSGPVLSQGSSERVDLSMSLRINPTVVSVRRNQVFTVNIEAQTQQFALDVASLHLNFDASAVRLIYIEPGSVLTKTIHSRVDNTLGQIDLDVGKLGGPFPQGRVVLATLHFRALSNATTSGLAFNTLGNRATRLYRSGGNALGNVGGGSIILQSTREVFLPLVIR